MRSYLRGIISLLFLYCSIASSHSYDLQKNLKANETPKELQNVGIEEKLGVHIPGELSFRDEQGKTVLLSDYLNKGRPVILSLVYFGCDNLCNFHLNGLSDAFKKLKAKMGDDYEVVSVSIDDKETPPLAQNKKNNYLKSLGSVGNANGWHFLTGDKAAIDNLAKQVGFKFKWNDETKQWAHASAAIILTPEGKVSRYLHGVLFEPKTLSLAITESSKFKISNLVDSFVLLCFRYDPHQSKYTVAVTNIMKIGGAATIAVMIFILGNFWFRQRYSLLNQGDS